MKQRGNYRQDVFAADEDRERYLGSVASAALTHGGVHPSAETANQERGCRRSSAEHDTFDP